MSKISERTLNWRITGKAYCKGCGEIKDNFTAVRSRSTGLYAPFTYCKDPCVKAFNAANNVKRREERARRAARYAALHPPEDIVPPDEKSDALRAAKEQPILNAPERIEAADRLGMRPADLKQCPTCNKWKPATVDYFEAKPKTKGGLSDECRQCSGTF